MKTKEQKETAYRIVKDSLAEKKIPAEALYGVQTLRALENFRISEMRIHSVRPYLYLTAMYPPRSAAPHTKRSRRWHVGGIEEASLLPGES